MAEQIKPPLFIQADNATDAFKELVRVVGTTGDESAPRGQKIKERLHTTVRINNPSDRYVKELFPASKKYAAAEMLYYFWNRTDLKGIAKWSKFWNDISDDGKHVRSAYGHIIREKHGFDQIQYVIDMLKKDPDTRKAVVQLKTPYAKDTLDNICTLALIFHIRNGKLHMHSIMRGNDIVFGFRYNVMFFSIIQEMISNELDVPMGTMTHTVSSMHIYEAHFGLIDKVLKTDEKIAHLAQDPDGQTIVKFKENEDNDKMKKTNDPFIGFAVPKYSELQYALNGEGKWSGKGLFAKFYEIIGETADEYIGNMEMEIANEK